VAYFDISTEDGVLIFVTLDNDTTSDSYAVGEADLTKIRDACNEAIIKKRQGVDFGVSIPLN